MTEPRLQVRRLDPRALPLRRMTPLAAGLDISACLPEGERVVVEPGARVKLPTGWALAIAAGFEGQVRPRSGLALRSGVTVLNAPGTIDADYRGELQVLLVNLGSEPVSIGHGDRIAQLVIVPIELCDALEVDELPDSRERGTGGFGSTGR